MTLSPRWYGSHNYYYKSRGGTWGCYNPTSLKEHYPHCSVTKNMLTVLDSDNKNGSPRCGVPIRPHAIWSRSPIQSIILTAINIRFSLATMDNMRDYKHDL